MHDAPKGIDATALRDVQQALARAVYALSDPGTIHHARRHLLSATLQLVFNDPSPFLKEADLITKLANHLKVTQQAPTTTSWPEDVWLTKRQCDVYHLAIRGLQHKEIAAQLGISTGTVTIHISSILKRTGAPTQARLIAWAQGREAPQCLD
jgi:DNA-binding NarL/FixJ family response regulator